MEETLKKLPPSIESEGNYYRLVIYKQKAHWLISYEQYQGMREQLVWKRHLKLRLALKFMLVWIIQNNYYKEELPPATFQDLP